MSGERGGKKVVWGEGINEGYKGEREEV